jgi:hypothetical protein
MKFRNRRPSPSMIVALVALFVALGGAGYAATTLPAGSVGNAQLQNGSVGNHKLAFNSVGTRKLIGGSVGRFQINAEQVQERVAGTCTTGAISSISETGTVACASTPGEEFDTSTQTPVGLDMGASPTGILSLPLASGSAYLLTANPQVNIAGEAKGDESVSVSCTLAATGTTGATQTRMVTVALGTSPQAETMPLTVPVPSNTSSANAALTCEETESGTSPPSVTVTAAINALQTAGNTTEPPAG